MTTKAQFDERKIRRQDDGRFGPLHKPQRDRPLINAAEAVADATADDGLEMPQLDRYDARVFHSTVNDAAKLLAAQHSEPAAGDEHDLGAMASRREWRMHESSKSMDWQRGLRDGMSDGMAVAGTIVPYVAAEHLRRQMKRMPGLVDDSDESYERVAAVLDGRVDELRAESAAKALASNTSASQHPSTRRVAYWVDWAGRCLDASGRSEEHRQRSDAPTMRPAPARGYPARYEGSESYPLGVLAAVCSKWQRIDEWRDEFVREVVDRERRRPAPRRRLVRRVT